MPPTRSPSHGITLRQSSRGLGAGGKFYSAEPGGADKFSAAVRKSTQGGDSVFTWRCEGDHLDKTREQALQV